MLKYPYLLEYEQAMHKEFIGLINYRTFEYKEHTNEKLVLLIQVYTNKFDENGFFTNFKAKLITRGNLYKTEEETYIATLVAQTFRAIAALIAAFDLKTWQYNIVIAFVNAKFRKLIPV